MNPLTNLLPASVRRFLYTVFGLVSLVMGAIQVWYASAGTDQPDWTTPTLAVLAYLGGALGFLAASNTPPPLELEGTVEVQGELEVKDDGAIDLGTALLVAVLLLVLLALLGVIG